MEMIKINLSVCKMLVLGILLGFQSKGQSEEEFEKFSEDVYTLITDTVTIPKLEYTRIKSYLQHIEEQDWDLSTKEEEKVFIQKNYRFEYEEFHKRLGLIVNRYQKEIKLGAQSEFLNFSYSPHPKWKNRYVAKLRMLYQYQEMQSIVEFEYELYYSGKALLLIGNEIVESF